MEGVTYYNPKDISGVLVVPHAVFSGIATIIVGLRFYTTRVVTRLPWTFDEYVCIAALVANHCMLFAECYAAHYGLGRPITVVSALPTGTTLFLKGILAIEITYGTACPLSKLAVLTMYYRLFSASPVLRYCVWGIASGLVGWSIAVVSVAIFSCTPIAGFWDVSIPSKCIDSSQFYIGITVPNIIFDFLTVFLPIHEVWTLQMGRDKKLAITGVFMIGGSVLLASFARLILFSIFRPGGGGGGNNVSQTVVIPHSASAIETCLAIIGACLPPCAPLLKRMLGRVMPSRGKSEEGGQKLGTLITIGKISGRSGEARRRTGRAEEDDVEGRFVRLEGGSVSLHGSTDELYKNEEEYRYRNGGGQGKDGGTRVVVLQKREGGGMELSEMEAGGRQ